MPASWPTSVKTFTTRTDNSDVVFAAHMNDVQDEINAIETSLGVGVKGAFGSVHARLTDIETNKAAATHTHDHGAALTGLSDDDHPQYVLRSTLTTNGDIYVREGGVVTRKAMGSAMYLLKVNSAGTGIEYGADEDTQIFASEGDLEIKNGKRFRWPYAVVVLGISATVDTPPTGASVIIDADKATAAAPTTWTSIYTTQANRPAVAAAAYVAAETTPDTTSFAAGDYIRIAIDQVGSTVAGADLHAYVRYRRA